MREMLNQDPNLKIEEIKDGEWSGARVFTKGKDASAIALGKNAMVNLEIDKDDGDALGMLWGLLDLKGLGSAID